jgi:hypothetical protein
VTGEPTIRTLSLGAGVQSTVLALMSADGTLPRVDYAIFADTGWEPQRVYDHLDQLTAVLDKASIPVLRVSNGNLRADALNPAHRYVSIPYFITRPDGTTVMGRRQCTSEYKLAPINRKIRELLGAKPPRFLRVPRGRVAEQWIGFSTDEVGRVSNHQPVSYLRHRYPLLELGMDRKACERWLRAHGWDDVAKSACIGCPYHGNKGWRDRRDNHPGEWADAVEFDQAIRGGGGRLRPGHTASLHRSGPLADAPIDRVTSAEWKSRQGSILDAIADAEMEEGDPDGCSPYGCRSGSPA